MRWAEASQSHSKSWKELQRPGSVNKFGQSPGWLTWSRRQLHNVLFRSPINNRDGKSRRSVVIILTLTILALARTTVDQLHSRNMFFKEWVENQNTWRNDSETGDICRPLRNYRYVMLISSNQTVVPMMAVVAIRFCLILIQRHNIMHYLL